MDFKQKTTQKKETMTTTLRQHLTSLQTWDASSPDSIQDQRTANTTLLLNYQIETNLRLMENVKKEVPPAAATKTASGKAVMTQAPAKETHKEKKERQKREKVAKSKHPSASDKSFDMVESLRSTNTTIDNSFQRMDVDLQKKAIINKVNPEILKAFSQGYKMNKKEQPATPEEEQKKRADEAFYMDYITTTEAPNLRKPILDKMVSQVMSIKMTEEMFTAEYLRKNAGQVNQNIGRLKAFQLVMEEEHNKKYFDSLPASFKSMLIIQCNSASTYESALKNILFSNAVDLKEGYYVSSTINVKTTVAKNDHAHSIKAARQAIAQTKTDKDSALDLWLEEEMNKEKASLQKDSDSMKIEAETMEGDIGGLNLTSFVTGYSFETLSKYRSMIEKNADKYNSNKKLIDKLYQELYRGVDSMGDLTLDAKAAQGVIDSLPAFNITYQESLLKNAAFDSIEETSSVLDKVRNQVNSITDILEHLLRDKPLSDAGAIALERFR